MICCQSVNMGYDTGTAACTFTTPDESCVYIVYRGTGDGEWLDNGIGMTRAVTVQQKRALAYFDQVVETMNIEEEQRLIVTGHSKGGNKAQFAAMETQYQKLLDVCYSVDGQGFSQQAIEGWKEKYGEIGYDKRRGKIYGIHGENDYVSVLGNSVIFEDQIRYVKTPVEKNNFAGYHDIKYMFATLAFDQASGSYYTVFNGRKNSDTGKRGELGEYAAMLSGKVMELTPEKRDGCAAVIMQLMEAADGQKRGINGEKLTLSDMLDFTLQGIPLIARSLLLEKEGRNLLEILRNPRTQLGEAYAEAVLQVNYSMLLRQTQEMERVVIKIQEISGEIKRMADFVPRYMKGDIDFSCRLSNSAGKVEQLGKKLQRAVRLQENISKSYQQWDGIDFFDKIR